MRDNFKQVMDWIGISEGGYVNHPRDPGGATDRGITQRTYDAYCDRHGLKRQPVRGIGKATAEEILASQYFAPVRFDDLPSGLDYAVADYAVNSGVSRAAKALQRIVGVTPDGVIGEITLAAVAGRDTADLIVALCEERMRFLRRLPTWGTFGKGWTARVMGTQPGVQAGDIGVIDRAVRLAGGRPGIPAPVTPAPGKALPGGGFWAALAAIVKGWWK